jgi:hypothetical protein
MQFWNGSTWFENVRGSKQKISNYNNNNQHSKNESVNFTIWRHDFRQALAFDVRNYRFCRFHHRSHIILFKKSQEIGPHDPWIRFLNNSSQRPSDHGYSASCICCSRASRSFLFVFAWTIFCNPSTTMSGLYGKSKISSFFTQNFGGLQGPEFWS